MSPPSGVQQPSWNRLDDPLHLVNQYLMTAPEGSTES